MHRVWIACGSLAGLTAVAMAAVAAHGLTWLEPARLEMVRSAVQMQAWHALALLACGLWTPRGGRVAHAAGFAFAVGLVAFSGAVYARGLVNLHTAFLAPTGGLLLMVGWALLGLSALRQTRPQRRR